MRAVLLAALIGLAVPVAHAQPRPAIALTEAEQQAIGIALAEVEAPAVFASTTAPAEVIAPGRGLQSAVTPFEGVVSTVIAMVGTEVAAGSPIVILEGRSFEADLSRLENQRLMMEHRAEIAETTRELHAIGVRSRLERDEAEHEAEAARIEYEALRARFQNIEAGDGPGLFVVNSPRDGIISHLPFVAGDAVPAGAAVASVFGGDAFWARAQLGEAAARGLRIGDRVFAMDGGEGRVLGIDPEIDAVTRSVEVIVSLPDNPDLRLGQLVTLAFGVEVPPGAVTLPSAALISFEGEPHVFVQMENGFEPRPVAIVRRSREAAIVTGALREGDRVVVSGLAALKNIAGGA